MARQPVIKMGNPDWKGHGYITIQERLRQIEIEKSTFRYRLKQKWRRVKRKCFCLLLLGLALVYLLNQKSPSTVTFARLKSLVQRKSPQGQSLKCDFPKLDPFAPQMMSLIAESRFQLNTSCLRYLGFFKGKPFHVEEGHILVRNVALNASINCCYEGFTANQDETVTMEAKCHQISHENPRTAIQFPTELLYVTCYTISDDQIFYRDVFQLFHEKPSVEKRIKKWEQGQSKDEDGRLSVIIIGMDTTSQMQFERAYPASKFFLDKNLSAVRFMGYNKVAANTLPNLIPLLSGMTRDEFENDCYKRGFLFLGAKRLRNCALIWNTFASEGYRTLFAEDAIEMSIFNLHYWDAFGDEPPTDYYGRHYAIYLQKWLGFKNFCYGYHLSFEAILDMVRSMTEVFQPKNRTTFSFVWSTRLQHHSLDDHHWGDQPLLELLEYLHEEGRLNNTALFLLGDHGYRNRDDIEQSFIENRQPLAYLALPRWFRNKYSQAYRNLKWNAENSVASPFDMHKTLLDFLDLERFLEKDENWRGNRHFNPKYWQMWARGQSLFEINPNGRDCESAGIPWMWCLCMERIPLKNDSFLAVKAAEAVISQINSKVSSLGNCEVIQLKRVLNASVVFVNRDTDKIPACRAITGNDTVQQFEAANRQGTCGNVLGVQLRVLGSPHDPIFKTMAVHNSGGKFLVTDPEENPLVRDDWYSEKGFCVKKEMQPYCICKQYNEKLQARPHYGKMFN